MLWGECISGALYIEDFKRLARDVGFADPRVLSSARIDVTDPELSQVVGNAVFHSITYRLFKLPEQLESLCEDYGQVAVYKVVLHCRHLLSVDCVARVQAHLQFCTDAFCHRLLHELMPYLSCTDAEWHLQPDMLVPDQHGLRSITL